MELNDNTSTKVIRKLSEALPSAVAHIKGSGKYPAIFGTTEFYQAKKGLYVVSAVFNLPFEEGMCGKGVLAMHIHNGGSCTGNSQDPFANSGTHYNPYNCLHPFHAGDMPPLFVNQRYAFSAFFTDRLKVNEIIGLPVIIHREADDFTSQPSGNSGEKIACGIISYRS